jgi:hypothetical protein
MVSNKRCASPGAPTIPCTKQTQKRTQTCAHNITITTRNQLRGIPQESPATLPEVFLCTSRRTRRTAKTQSTKSCTGTRTTKHKAEDDRQSNTQAKSFLEPLHPCTINGASRLAARIDFKTSYHQAVSFSPDLPGSCPFLFTVMARARCCLALLRRLTLQKNMQRPKDDAH